jgi:hypothetical protein
MACFPARQLGAEDFCTDGCDGDVARSSTDRELCVASGARLTRCRPSQETQTPTCSPGFRCLRTDLIADEGVCLRVNVCAKNEDCPDPVRSTCSAEVLAGYYPNANPQLDHLYCVQEGCHSRGSACPPGETCLRNIVPPSSRPADICVPHCDSNLNCPPNHFCYKKVSGTGAPAVCIPGLLGFRCTSHVDCLVGECIPTGEADIALCSVRCERDADCTRPPMANATAPRRRRSAARHAGWTVTAVSRTHAAPDIRPTPPSSTMVSAFCPVGRTTLARAGSASRTPASISSIHPSVMRESSACFVAATRSASAT